MLKNPRNFSKLFLVCILVSGQHVTTFAQQPDVCIDVAVEEPLQKKFSELFDNNACDPRPVQICEQHETGHVCEEKKRNVEAMITRIIGCLGTLSSRFVWDMSKEYMDIVSNITSIINNQANLRETLRIAIILRKDPRMNYRLWYRAMVGVTDNHPVLKNVVLKEIFEVMPELFLPSRVIDAIQNGDTRIGNGGGCPNRKCMLVDESEGVENGEENLLFYFREDIGINSHHSYWHGLHAWKRMNYTCVPDPRTVHLLNKTSCHEDRRSELFYYMHRSLLARYTTERLTHGVTPLTPYKFRVGGIIDTGYNPQMKTRLGSQHKWNNRPVNHPLPVCQTQI